MKRRGLLVALGLTVLGLTLLAGCERRPGRYRMAVDFLDPAAAGDGLVYIEAVRHAAYVVDPAGLAADDGRGGVVKPIDLRGEPRWATARAGSGGRQHLILAGTDPSLLWILGAESRKEAVELGQPFTRIGQAPGGDLLLMYFADGGVDRGLSGRSAVQVVVAAEALTASPVVELQSLGSPPRFVAISDAAAGAPRFVAVGFDGHLSLLVVDPLTAAIERHDSVGLQHADFHPAEVAFAGRWLVIREHERSELLALKLDEGGYFVTRLELGAEPLAIEGYRARACPAQDVQPHVAALVQDEDDTASIVVVDLELERRTGVALGFAAERLAPYGDDACDADPGSGLVAYAAEAEAGLALIDLRRFHSRAGANVERVLLSTGLARLRVVDDRDAARAGPSGSPAADGGGLDEVSDPLGPSLVLTYAGGGIGLLDLRSGALRAAAGGIDLDGAVFDRTSSSLWAGQDDSLKLDQVVLDDGSVRSVPLPAPIEALVPLGAWLAVVHPSTTGHVTLVDPSTGEAPVTRAGFLAPQLGEAPR